MTQRLLNLRRADTKRNGGERGEAGEIDSARKLKQKDGGEKKSLGRRWKIPCLSGENLHLAEMAGGFKWKQLPGPSTPARVRLKPGWTFSFTAPETRVFMQPESRGNFWENSGSCSPGRAGKQGKPQSCPVGIVKQRHSVTLRCLHLVETSGRDQLTELPLWSG